MSQSIKKIDLNKTKFFHRVKTGETLKTISQFYNVSETSLKLKNNIDDVVEGIVILVEKNEFQTHIVRPLETIQSIANFYGKSVEEIKTKNNINEVFIGMKLLI